MKGILNGVRVVDLTRYISGPFCGMLLADMGAEVIKVEKPGEGEISRTVGPWKNDVSLFFVTCNRNKKSVTADIRKPEGMAILKKLIAESDVLLENFRAGMMEKIGLGYEEVKKINPKIIMVSVSGFGQGGPWRDRPAFDGIISAVSGVTRMEDGHVERSKGAIHDHMAGMYAMMGTMLALYDRERTGKGQYVDVAMIASSTMVRSDAIANAYLNGDQAALEVDDSAHYVYLKATDGWINFHAGPNQMYHKLLTLIDDPFLHEERFYDDMMLRVEHSKELFARVQAWAEDKSCDELEQIFLETGIPCGIVATPGRLLRTEHLWERGYLIKQPVYGLEGEVPFMGFPIKLSEHQELEYKAPPAVGENTEEIYTSVLGMSQNEIEKLKEAGIV